MIKRIVTIGPESTGKSTLCELLAKHYQTQWCPEYAREYLLTNGKEYSFEDLEHIAKGQLALEEKHAAFVHESLTISGENTVTAQQKPLLFIDTDMYVMKVWCEYVFNKCHHFILDTIAEKQYDLYLLCNIDLPWVKDELREYPDEGPRQELYRIYKDILINQKTPWVEISGNYETRLQQAIAAIDTFI
ncbi:MAG: AAA family ATPase [Bacteroidota bacterium]|nr:AAA family ATPase [Bacteroidota bacterium]